MSLAGVETALSGGTGKTAGQETQRSHAWEADMAFR